jgi:hypothetical protein
MKGDDDLPCPNWRPCSDGPCWSASGAPGHWQETGSLKHRGADSLVVSPSRKKPEVLGPKPDLGSLAGDR